ncbi:sensor histidine kinase [Salinigranum sp. GCM10025319]|uniref:sensor histidine kinase n=1 Tax=Salinigranum sp. GCM10025319 TaxID=3252687 RepID=UPI0036189619
MDEGAADDSAGTVANGVTVRVGRLDDPAGEGNRNGSTRAQNGRGGFYVEDDGPGIPPETREAVFEVGHSTKPEGTGFGLWILHEIADAHDWELSITEGTDGGARFEVRNVAIESESDSEFGFDSDTDSS